MMTPRQTIATETVAAVAQQNAGHPLTAERAANHALVYEGILQMLDGLRALRLSEVEPATIFRPLEQNSNE